MRALRVLVVADSESVSAMVRQMGHVAALAGGQCAVRRAVVWNPDLILIDLSAPTINAIELACQIRRTPETAQTPLVALAGNLAGDRRRRAAEAGFNEFVPKPSMSDQLWDVLRRAEARAMQPRGV